MYKLTPISIVRLSDSASIPPDPENTDYAAYLVWLADGNTPEPADTVPVALTELLKLEQDNQITPRRLRETIMIMSEAFKQVTGGTLDLSQIPGVAQVYAVEARATELRTELGAHNNTLGSI
jgi:hypothetical protein